LGIPAVRAKPYPPLAAAPNSSDIQPRDISEQLQYTGTLAALQTAGSDGIPFLSVLCLQNSNSRDQPRILQARKTGTKEQKIPYLLCWSVTSPRARSTAVLLWCEHSMGKEETIFKKHWG
jgi:hypothetical protein